MVDSCNTHIYDVNKKAYHVGAKTVMRYAQFKGLKIINLWRDEDQPFYGITKEQIEDYLRNIFDNN